MPDNETSDAVVKDEEANAAVERGSKREEQEDDARDIVGGFRRSESAEPIDTALKEAEEDGKGRAK